MKLSKNRLGFLSQNNNWNLTDIYTGTPELDSNCMEKHILCHEFDPNQKESLIYLLFLGKNVINLYFPFCVDCTTGLPISLYAGRRPPLSTSPYWKNLVLSNGLDVVVKIDPNLREQMVDIKLPDQPPLSTLKHIIQTYEYGNDVIHDLHYIIHKDSAGKTVALSPVTPGYLKLIEAQMLEEQRRHGNK